MMVKSIIANSVNKVICSRSVTLSLIGGIREIPLKNIAYNLVIADSSFINLMGQEARHFFETGRTYAGHVLTRY
jgi:hypothetical protein